MNKYDANKKDPKKAFDNDKEKGAYNKDKPAQGGSPSQKPQVNPANKGSATSTTPTSSNTTNSPKR